MVFVFLLPAAIASATGTQWRQDLLNGSNHNKYCTYKEYDNILEAMLKKYPKLLRKEKVGQSFKQNPLHVYHFVDQDSKLQKDQVFINSLIHAREAQTVLTLMDYLARTLEAIEKGDPQALYTVKRRHIVFMPFINIDSYIANEKSRIHMIRKNQRNVCSRGREGQNGVDLNRNFPVGWEEASSEICGETYRGATPFSEPETQTLKRVVENHKFKVSYTIHGFGQMLIRPGKPFVNIPDAHLKVFHEFQQVINQKKYGTVQQVLGYKATGGSDGWLYQEHGIFAMTPEVGTAFWVRDRERAGFLEKEWPRTRYVVYKTGCEPRVDLSKNGVEFSVANDGVSDCPSLKLAFSSGGGDPVVVDVGTIPARASKKSPGKTGDVKKICVKEEGLDVCICNPTSPGEGTWENNTNALCAALVTADSTTPPSSSSPPSSSPSSSSPPSSFPSSPSSPSSPPSSPPSSSANSPNSDPSSPSTPSSEESGINTTLAIIIIASMAIVALASFALFSKKRNNQNLQLSGLGTQLSDKKKRKPLPKHGRLKEKTQKGRKDVKSERRE